MRQIVQLEGSNWCGAITSCMILDHFGIKWNLQEAQERYAEYERVKVEDYGGVRSRNFVASFLAEQGLYTLCVSFGLPVFLNPEHKRYWPSHLPRQNRINTWYCAYDLIKSGYVAIVAIERDASKYHYVVVDDAFLRAGEHWFSVWCPIRGHYEEQAERFLLTVEGKSHADEWTFTKRAPVRFASAAAAVREDIGDAPTDHNNP